jgi:hypothetical protein
MADNSTLSRPRSASTTTTSSRRKNKGAAKKSANKAAKATGTKKVPREPRDEFDSDGDSIEF